MQLCGSLSTLWHHLSLGLEWKLTFFQSCGHCWVFQICWHIECSTFTASSFRIWNMSTGISSPPLALFIVMLPKAHLMPLSRMSTARWVWVITPSWLSGSWRSFLYSPSVYSCHLLISSASVRSIQFLSSDSHFAVLHLFFLGMVLLPVSYTMSHTSVHSSSGTLSLKSISHFHCIIFKDLF